LIRGEQPSRSVSGVEIEEHKDRLLETASQREVTWISELFSDGPGPHIEECPVAERGAGSWEAFFALEATGSLDTIDRLRAELARDSAGAKKIGDRLSFTFRQLRERAVTFGHADLGRVARRAGAAVTAIIEEPPARLRGFAVDLAITVAALRSYLEASTREDRGDALRRAEESLRAATHPAKQIPVPIESLTYSAADALSRARELSDEAKVMLDSQVPDHSRAQLLLEEAVGMVEHALEGAGSER
jgi:hypothetical protein